MSRPISTIAAYTFLEAVRNRLLWLVVAFVAVAFSLAEFLGEVTLTETREFQSAFMGATLRGFAVFMVSLFVITSMVRELNDKGLELVLSLPIPRGRYFLGKLAGFSLLAALTSVLCSLCLLLYAPGFQVAVWGISLALELLIVTAFSLLCLFTFSHVTLALSVVMGFYLLSRTISAIQLIGAGPLADTGPISQQVINAFLAGLGFLLPELDRFTVTEWLVYHTGGWESLLPIAIQTLIYVAFISAAAMFDLYRKNL